ncbi:MAG: glycosyltransferase [Coriobacteriia bacterium]|nr:glycosyltransferase [Coriobacteriia bacterium]
MTLSLITVCYNSADTLARTLDSVLAQTESVDEYLIVDAQSTDGTLEIIESYIPQFEGALRYISEPDDGIFDAMNKGISRVNGDIIGLLNSDDEWLPETVAHVKKTFAEHPEAAAVHGRAQYVAEDGSISLFPSILDATIDDAMYRMPIAHPALFVRKETYERYGMFDLRFRIAADYDFTFRLIKAGAPIIGIEDVLAKYHRGGACDQHKPLMRKETIQVKVAHGGNFWTFYPRYLMRRIGEKLGF